MKKLELTYKDLPLNTSMLPEGFTFIVDNDDGWMPYFQEVRKTLGGEINLRVWFHRAYPGSSDE